MKIKIKSNKSTENSTISKMYIDGNFVCYTLEDVVRDKKIAGETAIPEGKYKITLRNEGGKNESYKKMYPSMHKGMLYVNDVPNYEYVLIHKGNTKKDTEGCLLVGEDIGVDSVSNSAKAYEKIYPIISKALLNKEEVTLIIERFKEVEDIKEESVKVKEERVYTVVKGDTLWGIASKEYIYNDGSKYTDLIKINDLKTKILQVGQKIKY